MMLASCSTVKNTDTSLLKNDWKHAYEEDKDGISVFRPSISQDFAPSMYRLQLILKDSNEAEYLVLSPVDAHYMESGKWDYDAGTRQLVITDKEGKTVHQYEIVEVTDNLLRVKELNATSPQ